MRLGIGRNGTLVHFERIECCTEASVALAPVRGDLDAGLGIVEGLLVLLGLEISSRPVAVVCI